MIGRREMRTGPPDFIGVGALGSGTRRWHQMLLEHPEIEAPPDGRQLHFFSDFCGRPMRDEDVAEYHARFPRRAGRIIGEWTPRYMLDAWTPMLLRRAAPDARIIALVSDPLLRYRLRIARTHTQAADPEEEILYLVDAVARGRYGSQLRNLREWFPPEQILVLQLERCLADPLPAYARTLRFLGVRDDFVPRRYRRLAKGKTGPVWFVRALRAEGLGARVRRRSGREPPPLEPAELWPDIEASLLDELGPEVELLHTMVPELDLSLWPAFAATRPA